MTSWEDVLIRPASTQPPDRREARARRRAAPPTLDARLQPDTPEAQEVRHADRERLLERRIARMLVVDVRDG